jgi:hypothetical protein
MIKIKVIITMQFSVVVDLVFEQILHIHFPVHRPVMSPPAVDTEQDAVPTVRFVPML